MVETRSLYLTWAWISTGSWRTDRFTIASMHLALGAVARNKIWHSFNCNRKSNLKGSRSSLLPMMDRAALPGSLEPVRDSKKPLDEVDFTTVGICRPSGGKPMPSRPASRHLTVAGNVRLVRASFCSCQAHTQTHRVAALHLVNDTLTTLTTNSTCKAHFGHGFNIETRAVPNSRLYYSAEYE